MDKGIRQKSTKEWTHSLTAVPFVRGHRSVFPRTPWNTGVYTRHPTFVTATSGVLTRLPEKLSKNGMRVYTLSDRRSEKKLRVYMYTASEAKGLKTPALALVGIYVNHLTIIFLGGCRGVLYHDAFSALYLLFLLITQYKYTFLESCFFSFIWCHIRLNIVKLEGGHDLNNMKSMEFFFISHPMPW